MARIQPRRRRGSDKAARPNLAYVVGIVVQAVLTVVGLTFVFADFSDEISILILVSWCALGTLYCAVMIGLLTLSLRRRRPTHAEHLVSLQTSALAHVAGIVGVFASSVVGVFAAAYMILMRNEPAWSGQIEIIGVWAILLSWALFHWGFAQLYVSTFYNSPQPPLVFPGTPNPRLTDFVYFAYTNATTFSVSDVHITDSRMRWRVMWHQLWASY